MSALLWDALARSLRSEIAVFALVVDFIPSPAPLTPSSQQSSFGASASLRETRLRSQARISSDRLAEVDLQPLAAGDFEPARVEAELVQDGGVDVGDVVAVLDGVEAELVGGAVGDAALDAAAGQPDREAVGVVVAAVGALRRRACGRTRWPRRRASRRAGRAA